ncbi:MAG: hypothetical protein WDM88_00375 [Galbitalea sp.]
MAHLTTTFTGSWLDSHGKVRADVDGAGLRGLPRGPEEAAPGHHAQGETARPDLLPAVGRPVGFRGPLGAVRSHRDQGRKLVRRAEAREPSRAVRRSHGRPRL